MKKRIQLGVVSGAIAIAAVIAVGGLQAGNLWSNLHMANMAGLVIDTYDDNTRSASGSNPIAAGDTCLFGYPVSTSITEISKREYTGKKTAYGRSLFYYSDTITATDGTQTVHYYREEVKFVYMTISADGTTIAASATVLPTDASTVNLWRVVQGDNDGTNYRRYQNLATGQWVRTEVGTDGTVTITLVDAYENSSAIDHQWTRVLDYKTHLRTLAYPLVSDGAGTEYYLYFDKKNDRWAYTSDPSTTTIHPAYYEKWSYAEDQDSLIATTWCSDTYYAYEPDSAKAEADSTAMLYIYPQMTIWSGYYSVAGVQDGYDTEWLYSENTLTLDFRKMQKRGYGHTCSLINDGGKSLPVYKWYSDITAPGIYNQPGAEWGMQYRDTARLMIDYRVMKDSLDWGTDDDPDPFKMQWFVVQFFPKGRSPLNYVTGTYYSRPDGAYWADFTDTLRFAITKNGQEVYYYKQPIIRESYHYYHEQKLVPYLSQSQIIFPADGGSVEVTYDSLVVENTIKLYTKERVEKAAIELGREKLTPGSEELLDRVEHSAKLEEDPCSWLTITADKEFDEGGTSITLTAEANPLNVNRSNVLLHYFKNKEMKTTYTRVIPIEQLNHASAGEIDFVPQGGWGYTTVDDEGRQSVHTHETTIYYYPGEKVELRPRERNFFGWQRWYDYNTGADPRFYRSRKDGTYKTQSDFYQRPPAKNINDNGVSLWLYDSINSTPSTSQGLYYAMEKGRGWMWAGLDEAGSLNEQEAALSNMVIPVVLGWDTTGNDLPAERDIAVDMSNYTDYKIDLASAKQVQEPTISYRQIFHLRPASQMADSLSKFTAKSGNYFEDYTITAPVGKNVILRTKYASAYPYNDNATMDRPSDLCYFVPVKINTLGTPRDTLLRLSMSANLDSVEVRFYKNGVLQTPAMQVADGTDYPQARNTLGSRYDFRTVQRAIPDSVVYEYRIEPAANGTYGGSFGKTIWDKYNGISLADTLLLARWTIHFAVASDYGPSTTALITKEDIERNYVLLAEQNFDYDKPGTTNCVIYPKPLGAQESSFGYCYPYSVTQGQSFRGTRSMSGSGDQIPFPFYGEYAIVNAIGTNCPSEQGQYAYWGKNIAQHGGAENGYCLYVDGAQLPGKVVTLSTNATICSGQQLYCAAWVANANYNNKTQPILQFDIEGRVAGGEWESIGAFCTGPLDGSVNWQQVNFPLVGAQNYDETRISVMNYASDNDGNDFLLDDIYLYASPTPLESFQASTDCSRNAKGDQMVTIIKADYTQFTGVDKYNTQLFYDIYDVSKGKAIKTNYYQDGKSVSADYGYLVTPAKDFTPTEAETAVSAKALLDSIAQYDSDTTLLRYIRNYESGKERWIIYLAQLVHQSPLSAKKNYEVRTAYAKDELSEAACAMRTKLPVFEKTAFVFNGETYPAAGQCANGLYPLEILVTDTLTDGDKLIHLQAYAKGDWLLGIDSDDAWYYSYLDPDEDVAYQEMTTERETQCNAAFEAAYGYTREQVDAAIADLRRDTINQKSNYLATDLSKVNANTEYWDDQSHYEIIKTLVEQKKLVLWQERQQIYMRSEDTCRYWIYPIAGTAKTVYNGNTYILNECANPTYIMVFSVKSDYVLNLSNKATADITGNDVPRVRISEHNAHNQFYVPIKEIGKNVAICYDSTQVVLSTDPVVSPLIGTPGFSMHFSQDKFNGYDGASANYYDVGDSIVFHYIDQDHVDSMKWVHNNQSGWKEGHPGLWVVNSHPMRAGYEYTLRLQMKVRGTTAEMDDGDSGCLLGYSYINVVVVPDTVIWTPTAMTGDSLYLWGDDRNWRGIVDGKVLDHGYAPLKNTMVILPEHNADFLDEMKYPTIQPDCDPYILYPEDVHYHTNVCKKVQFRSGAKIIGQEYLAYNEAYVNATLPANDWYTVASPMQATYSGDLFVPHTGKYSAGASTESSADFEVNGFQGERTKYAAYAVWASYYNQNVTVVTPTGWDYRYSTTADFIESNTMGKKLEPGQGFAVAGFGPTDDTQSLTIKLPKPDTEYEYYDSVTLQPNGMVETLDRDSAYRLGFVPASDGAMHITLTILNQKTDGSATPIAGQQGFLFGNPTMAYINMAKFLDDNQNVLNIGSYQVEVDGKWETIKRDVTTTDLFLRPMQSAMVASQDVTGDIRTVEVSLKPEHLSLVPRNRTTTRQASAHARAQGRTLRPELMKITALSGGQDKDGDWQYQRGETQLALMDFTSNGYDSNEDVRLISSGVEYGVNDNTLTTPVNIYTLADNQPLAADLRPEMKTVPLGFVLHSDFRSDSLTLYFHTSTNWSEECYLCDSKTGEKTRLYNDICVRIATPANHEIRYYLQGEADTPDNPNDTPTDNAIPAIDTDGVEQITAFSNAQESIVVVASSDIAEIRVYDLVGRLLTSAAPTVGTSVCTLTAPSGIALVYVRLQSAAIGHQKVLVK